MGSLKRTCGVCDAKSTRDEMYKVNMNMGDGRTSVIICQNCATQLLISTEDLKRQLGETD